MRKKKKKKKRGEAASLCWLHRYMEMSLKTLRRDCLPRESISLLKMRRGRRWMQPKFIYHLIWHSWLMDENLCLESMPTSRFAGSRPVRRRHTAPNSEDEHKVRVQEESKFATHMSLIC